MPQDLKCQHFSIVNCLTCADIDMESCEAEKSILRRRLSESASEVERWVRILQMLKTFLLSMCLFREIFKVVNSCHFHFSSAEKKMLRLMLQLCQVKHLLIDFSITFARKQLHICAKSWNEDTKMLKRMNRLTLVSLLIIQ